MSRLLAALVALAAVWLWTRPEARCPRCGEGLHKGEEWCWFCGLAR